MKFILPISHVSKRNYMIFILCGSEEKRSLNGILKLRIYS